MPPTNLNEVSEVVNRGSFYESYVLFRSNLDEKESSFEIVVTLSNFASYLAR